jgi:prophage tail gpP-like protein
MTLLVTAAFDGSDEADAVAVVPVEDAAEGMTEAVGARGTGVLVVDEEATMLPVVVPDAAEGAVIEAGNSTSDSESEETAKKRVSDSARDGVSLLAELERNKGRTVNGSQFRFQLDLDWGATLRAFPVWLQLFARSRRAYRISATARTE